MSNTERLADLDTATCTCDQDGWCEAHHVVCACVSIWCLNSCVCGGAGMRDAVDERIDCDCRFEQPDARAELADRALDLEAVA